MLYLLNQDIKKYETNKYKGKLRENTIKYDIVISSMKNLNMPLT